MGMEIVTKEDLQELRLQLLNDLKELLSVIPVKQEKQWLKNNEVMKLLQISANTVQRLRIAGKLKSSKIGGIHYYRLEDIQKLFVHGT